MDDAGGSSKSQMQVPPELRQGLANITDIGENLYYNQPEWSKQLPSTYVGPSSPTQTAIGQLTQRGSGQQPLYGQAEDALSGVIGSTSLEGLPGIGRIARGEDSITMAGANPYADEMFNKISDQIRTGVAGNMNARGLAGMAPKIEQRVLGKNIGDAATSFYGDIYDRNVDRDIAVQGANLDNRMSATGMLSDINARNASTRLAGIDRLPGLASYGDRGIDQLLTAGGLTEGYQQSAADDYRDRFEGDRDRQWDLASRYANILGIGGSIAPKTTETTQNPGLMGWLDFIF